MRLKLMAALAASLAAAALCACGTADVYSDGIRGYREDSAFGEGSLLAVYDQEGDRYLKDYIGAPLLAETPEEIGGIVTLGREENGFSVTLSDAATGEAIASRSAATAEFACEWAAEKWSVYATTHDISLALAKGECGNGTALAVRRGDRYYYPREIPEGDTVPEDLRAEKPEDVFAFVDFERQCLVRPSDGAEFARSDYYPKGAYKDGGDGAWLRYGIDGMKYAASMRELFETCWPGDGAKIAAFDEAGQQWTMDFLNDRDLARTPGEAGLKAVYSWSREDMVGFYAGRTVIGSGKVLTVTLTEFSSGRVFARKKFTASKPGTVKPSATSFEGVFDAEGVSKWLSDQCTWYLPNYLMSGRAGEAGGGSRYVAYDCGSGWYTSERLPSGIRARTPEEIRAVVRLTSTWRDSSGWYSVYGAPVEHIQGRSEVIQIEVVSPDGSRTLTSGKIDAGSPEKLTAADSYTSSSYIHSVTSDEIARWLDRHVY